MLGGKPSWAQFTENLNRKELSYSRKCRIICRNWLEFQVHPVDVEPFVHRNHRMTGQMLRTKFCFQGQLEIFENSLSWFGVSQEVYRTILGMEAEGEEKDCFGRKPAQFGEMRCIQEEWEE